MIVTQEIGYLRLFGIEPELLKLDMSLEGYGARTDQVEAPFDHTRYFLPVRW